MGIEVERGFDCETTNKERTKGAFGSVGIIHQERPTSNCRCGNRMASALHWLDGMSTPSVSAVNGGLCRVQGKAWSIISSPLFSFCTTDGGMVDGVGRGGWEAGRLAGLPSAIVRGEVKPSYSFREERLPSIPCDEVVTELWVGSVFEGLQLCDAGKEAIGFGGVLPPFSPFPLGRERAGRKSHRFISDCWL